MKPIRFIGAAVLLGLLIGLAAGEQVKRPAVTSHITVMTLEGRVKKVVHSAPRLFEAPNWSLRVSLANLPDDVYDDIGRGVRAVARGYRDAFEASKRAPKA